MLNPGALPNRYRFGFLGVSLRPDLARVIAEIFLEEGSWEATRARVLATNALQCRSHLTLRRLEQELRRRLTTLTQAQLQLLATAAGPDRAAMAWLATLRQARFLFDFAAEVLRDKLASGDPVLRYSDYEDFLDTHIRTDSGELRAATRTRVRQILLHMLSEAALIRGGRKTVLVQRPPLGAAALDVIVADDARWLAGFLYTDEEVEAIRCR
jgi:hypothetical protein